MAAAAAAAVDDEVGSAPGEFTLLPLELELRNGGEEINSVKSLLVPRNSWRLFKIFWVP